MLPERNSAHVVEARKLLIGQFRGKPVIQAFLDAYVKRLQDVEDVLWDVVDKRILDNATAAQLETLGKLVGEIRRGRTDAQFRLGIRIRIRVNRSKGRITDVIDVAGLANAPGTPVVEELRYLNFHVETYEQIGEQYLADYLTDTRAASSYGCLVASDLPLSELLQFDDAEAPDATIETFGDIDRTGVLPEGASGCGKLAAACYGLPENRKGVVLIGNVPYPAPRIDCLDDDGVGGIIVHGAFFSEAISVEISGSPVSFTFVNDARILVAGTSLSAGGSAVGTENDIPLLVETSGALLEVTTPYGTGSYPYSDTAILMDP